MDRNKKESKKTKLQKVNAIHSWAHLPYVVLDEIFKYLNRRDLRNATAVCRNWRSHFFHPRWWRSVKIPLLRNELRKAKFMSENFGHIAVHPQIYLDLTYHRAAEEFILLLERLAKNNNIRTLAILPPHCQKTDIIYNWEQNESLVRRLLENIIPKLEKVAMGNLEDMPMSIDDFCQRLNPSLEGLLLASQRCSILRKHEFTFDPRILIRFTKLEVLSITVNQFSDELLRSLDSARRLRRLFILTHNINITYMIHEETWILFNKSHRKCRTKLIIPYDFLHFHEFDREWSQYMPTDQLGVMVCRKCKRSSAYKKLATHLKLSGPNGLPHTSRSPIIPVEWWYCDLI